MMICPKCEKEIEESSKFCKHCGAKVLMSCPNCKKEIEKNSKFCKYCGANIHEVEEQSERTKKIRDVASYDIPKIIPSNMLKEGEKIIFEARPHKVYTLLASWSFGVLCSIIAAFFIIGDSGALVGEAYPGALFVGIIVGIIALLVPFIHYLRRKHTIYALTTERVISLKGIIGKDVYESRLEKIQDFRLKIDPVKKSLDVEI